MADASIFSFTDYRSFLKSRISSPEKEWGLLTKLAKAAGCHRPYLSKVLAGDAHFVPSHLFGLAKFWGLSEPETEYFLRLLELEKAGSAEYRAHLVEKNAELRRQQESLSEVVSREPVSESHISYYSSWAWAAAHVLTSIPSFQTTKAIARRLSLPLPQVEHILRSLEAWGSVKREKDLWKFAGNEHHISKASPLSTFHHSNWRQRAILNSQLQQPKSLHFTVVQSISEKDFEVLRGMILNFIREFSKVAAPSREEKLVCFNCDFFEP